MLHYRLLAFLLAVSTLSFSQQRYVENYTPANGLLDARVTRIFQDQRGLLYFLTWEGVSIFDGQSFHNISEYKGEAIGLVNEMIQWKGDTCYLFTFRKGAFKLINNQLIKDSLLDHIYEPTRVIATEKNEWIIIANGGLYKWNGAVPRQLLIQSGQEPAKEIDQAIYLNGQLIYFKQAENILRIMRLDNGAITSSLAGQRTEAITGNSSGNIFVKLGGQWLQLNPTALRNGQLLTEPLSFAAAIPKHFHIDQLYVTGDHIWIQDQTNGFLLLDTQTGITEFYPATGSIDAGANIVFGDLTNNFWISSFNKKVQKVFFTPLRKIEMPAVQQYAALQSDEMGQSIALLDNNAYLLQNGQYRLLTGSGQQPISFYWQSKAWHLKENWLFRNNHGDAIDLRKASTGDSSYFHSNRFSFDEEGRLLISGSSLYLVDKDLSVHGKQLPYFTDNLVSANRNEYIAITRNAAIWNYSWNADSLKGKQFVSQLPHLDPRCAIRWNQDTFCIGTRFQGIIWMIIQQGMAREIGRISTAKGLSNNFVIALAKKQNQLYVGTGTGFDRITLNQKDTTVENLGAANNLYASFNWVQKNKLDEVYALSSDNQVWQVVDNQQNSSSFTPAVWFREIEVNGKKRAETEQLYNYYQNNFRFAISAPCFTNAANIRFLFQLKNGNREWQQLSSDNVFNITNLPPGRYNLTLTVMYPDKIYPDKSLHWSFTIQSPLWKQWWFILLSLLVSFAIIWALIRAYYLKKLALQKAEADKQQAIEKERNRISRDMHDDLGSGLTKIAILSEVAKKQMPEPEKAKEQLEKISQSSRELVDSLQDIIWVLNPANDTLESLAAYLREYTLKFVEPFSLETFFDYPEHFAAIQLSEEKRRNVFLTVKESLHNIARHAHATRIDISISEEPGVFTLLIRDNGQGFDTANIRVFGNGLKNMESRISQAGGIYQISSAPGKGTLTSIRMPV